MQRTVKWIFSLWQQKINEECYCEIRVELWAKSVACESFEFFRYEVKRLLGIIKLFTVPSMELFKLINMRGLDILESCWIFCERNWSSKNFFVLFDIFDLSPRLFKILSNFCVRKRFLIFNLSCRLLGYSNSYEKINQRIFPEQRKTLQGG